MYVGLGVMNLSISLSLSRWYIYFLMLSSTNGKYESSALSEVRHEILVYAVYFVYSVEHGCVCQNGKPMKISWHFFNNKHGFIHTIDCFYGFIVLINHSMIIYFMSPINYDLLFLCCFRWGYYNNHPGYQVCRCILWAFTTQINCLKKLCHKRFIYLNLNHENIGLLFVDIK